MSSRETREADVLYPRFASTLKTPSFQMDETVSSERDRRKELKVDRKSPPLRLRKVQRKKLPQPLGRDLHRRRRQMVRVKRSPFLIRWTANLLIVLFLLGVGVVTYRASSMLFSGEKIRVAKLVKIDPQVKKYIPFLKDHKRVVKKGKRLKKSL